MDGDQKRIGKDLKTTGNFKEGLETPIQFCPGVGPKRARLFEKLEIRTVRDLLWHFPRGYEDFHNISPIRLLTVGQVATVLGIVVSVEGRTPHARGTLRHILHVHVKDSTGFLRVVWFNQAFLQKKIAVGQRLLLHGKVEVYGAVAQMSSPKFHIFAADQENVDIQGVVPLYPLCDGLTQNIVKSAIQKSLEKYGDFCREFLPESILHTYGYPSRAQAFHTLHHPQPGDGAPTDHPSCQLNLELEEGKEISPVLFQTGKSGSLWERARQRMIFEEFFLYQYILRQVNGKRKQETGIIHPKPDPDPWTDCDDNLDLQDRRSWPARFVRNLPFSFTEDQIRVCHEIEMDMHRSQPMSRLLQGDVGSGKTVVSLYAMMIAVAGGSQAALMVPTEILARQHANSIRAMTRSIPSIRIAVLRGSAKAKERRENMELIRTGTAQIIIGTHALFQDQVEFANLGLVVVDEQHKFGVDQRHKLIEKGNCPDLLVATATPIPRTLSLTLFGDMDVSVIRSLPPGRPPLITRWTTWGKEGKVWEFVDEKIADGQQVYVVCPIIEPSETYPNLPSTEEAFERLSDTFFPHRRVAILHGKHSAELKEELMIKLQAGEIDVVVATTVIEVGVDLPNATIMVILGAERFGLAQLHQLRGRVGRGTEKSYCVLVTHPHIAPYAVQRMRILEKTRDGFQIAEEDLRLRGPGEQFGVRQSGRIQFRLADPLRDIELLQEANRQASSIYENDPQLLFPEHRILQQELKLSFQRMDTFRPS